MKVLLTIADEEDVLKVDIPIIPNIGSEIILSPTDRKKFLKIISKKREEVALETLCIEGISTEQQDFFDNVFVDFLQVEAVNICWDKEENAYLPLILMLPNEESIEEMFNDMQEQLQLEQKKQKKSKKKLSN